MGLEQKQIMWFCNMFTNFCLFIYLLQRKNEIVGKSLGELEAAATITAEVGAGLKSEFKHIIILKDDDSFCHTGRFNVGQHFQQPPYNLWWINTTK